MITPWPVPPSKREKGSCFTISTNLRRSLTVRKLKIAVTNCRAPIDLDRSPAISRIYRILAHPRNEKRESNSSRAKHPLTISSQMIHQTTTSKLARTLVGNIAPCRPGLEGALASPRTPVMAQQRALRPRRLKCVASGTPRTIDRLAGATSGLVLLASRRRR